MRTYLLVSVLLIGCGSSRDRTSDEEADAGSDASVESDELARFSFFVTSLASLQELAGDRAGFGGDLRFGETGAGAGLRGADKICTTTAELSMKGSGAKVWRAFLSTSRSDARDRVGEGPWYDRKGRLIAEDLDSLLNERPDGDPEIINDLPNELGVPNHDPDGTGSVDNHDMLTGSDAKGRLFCPDDHARCTCDDWTSSAPSGQPRVGHSWPRTVMGADGTIDFGFGGLGTPSFGGLPGPFADGGGFGPPGVMFGEGGFPPFFADGGLPAFPGLADGGLPAFPGFADGGAPDFGALGAGAGADVSMNNWMSALNEAGCAPGVNLIEMGGPNPNNATVGSGGGYGGFYCFALSP